MLQSIQNSPKISKYLRFFLTNSKNSYKFAIDSRCLLRHRVLRMRPPPNVHQTQRHLSVLRQGTVFGLTDGGRDEIESRYIEKRLSVHLFLTHRNFATSKYRHEQCNNRCSLVVFIDIPISIVYSCTFWCVLIVV